MKFLDKGDLLFLLFITAVLGGMAYTISRLGG
jgi:hypothetical protein